MGKMDVHYSSLRGDWGTPKGLFAELNKEFAFTLDPCATQANAKCEKYYTPEQDGLKQEWGGAVFVNPPYGRGIGDWIKKAWDEVAAGHASVVVLLIPSRTDTRWWHTYIMHAQEIRFIQGRLRFDDQKNPAPFPSAIAIFKKQASL